MRARSFAPRAVATCFVVASLAIPARADDGDDPAPPANTASPATESPAGDVTSPSGAPAAEARARVPSAPVVEERPAAPTAGPLLTDDERYRRAVNLFEYGDCESVIDVLADLAIRGAGGDEARLAETHRMLGICFFQLGRRAEAERELKSLLYLNPDYELDPFLTPPPVVDLFDVLKAGLKEKLADVRRAREAARRETQSAKTLVVERTTTVVVTPWQTVLLPFGLAQAANGENVKAVLFGVGEGALLVVNVASWALLQALRPAPDGAFLPVQGTLSLGGDDISLQAVLAQAAWGVMAVSLGALVVVYLAGIGDAWWNHEAEAIVDVEEGPPRPLDDAAFNESRAPVRARTDARALADASALGDTAHRASDDDDGPRARAGQGGAARHQTTRPANGTAALGHPGRLDTAATGDHAWRR